MFPEVYQTSQPSELINKIRVTGLDAAGKIAPYSKVLMFNLKLDNIKAGDVISLASYGQVSNPNVFSYDDHRNPTSAIMFCYGTVLSRDSWDLVGLEEITEFRGKNITAERHHEPWDINTHYVFINDYSYIYINTVVYAATAALKPGSTATYLTVDQDYARSSILLFRK